MLLLFRGLLASLWLMGRIIDVNRLEVEDLNQHLLHGFSCFALLLRAGVGGEKLLVERVRIGEVGWEKLSVRLFSGSEGGGH